ncbi:MAG: hypothetical protein U9N33_06500 [Campylobacterota bacterium]|nr:hypothetical protein [Campylobacterota bacterium]
MAFTPHTQEELSKLNIIVGNTYSIRYANKDYYNAEETIEVGKGTAILTDGNIYFNVVDPYGMDKLMMKVRYIG